MARGRSRGRVSAKRWREEVRGGSNYLKLPEGVKMFSGKPGTYRLDFMSYVAGAGNPRAEKGEPYFERTFFVHQGIGPNQDWHLCLARTMKKPCPICEHRAKLSADPEADEALIKALAPKERQLWIVKDLMNDPDAIQIWEVSYHLFGRMLKDKINNSDEEDGYDYFADPVDGLTMRLALQQSDKGKWTETGDIEFRQRKTPYDSEIVGEMPCLDDLLVATPYDKLKALFLQTEEADEADEELDAGVDDEKERRSSGRGKRDGKDVEPQGKLKRKLDSEFASGDLVWYKDEKCEVLRVSGDGTSLTLEDPEGEFLRGIDPNDVELVQQESKESKGVEDEPERKKPASRKESKEDEDDEEDEPEKKPARRQTKTAEPERSKKPKKPKEPKSDDDDWDNW